FAPATLTAISSYQTLDSDFAIDISTQFIPVLQAFFGRTYSSVGYPNEVSVDKFAQEVRLASGERQLIEWVVGAFYTREKLGKFGCLNLRGVAGVPSPNDMFTVPAPSRYEGYAGFADVTCRVSEKFDMQGVVRYATNDQELRQSGSVLLIGSAPTRE